MAMGSHLKFHVVPTHVPCTAALAAFFKLCSSILMYTVGDSATHDARALFDSGPDGPAPHETVDRGTKFYYLNFTLLVAIYFAITLRYLSRFPPNSESRVPAFFAAPAHLGFAGPWVTNICGSAGCPGCSFSDYSTVLSALAVTGSTGA